MSTFISSKNQKPKFILSFDVNQTILARDPAASLNVTQTINSILAKSCVGVISRKCLNYIHNNNDNLSNNDIESLLYQWKSLKTENINTNMKKDDVIITFQGFLEKLYSFKRKGPRNEAASYNNQIRSKKNYYKGRFTDPGFPGDMFRDEYNDMLNALTRKNPSSEDPYYFIIPSFFDTIIYLHENGFHFKIVFRTFGIDLPNVIQEFNEFCTGEHPDYPHIRFDGSNGSPDFRIQSATAVGAFYRNDGTNILAVGTMQQPELSQGERFYLDEDNSFRVCRSETEISSPYSECGTDICLINNILDIHQYILHSSNQVLALRDYYPWWNASGEAAQQGKIHVIDVDDDHTISLFFDDNIKNQGSKNIVDIRNVDGNRLSVSDFYDSALFRVVTCDAILNRNYFIDIIKRVNKQQQIE
eukprot:gb/GECH01013564.1/.p1 GENE.gb/GECH01013564.1/~~gb/GECH01013564.1/.p1  ORF type:complete len:416 (+),score=76.97 gb/GECH01013564.1/:1-1248(+)